MAGFLYGKLYKSTSASLRRSRENDQGILHNNKSFVFLHLSSFCANTWLGCWVNAELLRTPWYAAEFAFCSAWRALHISCLWPEGTRSSSLKHLPISKQLLTPLGAPLYPVVSILLSLTIIAPTLRLRHVEREATVFVMETKYSSQEGRLFNSSFICLKPFTFWKNQFSVL